MKKYVVGVDVGGTNTEYAIIDEEGKIYANRNISTRCCETFDEYISFLAEDILKLAEENGFKGKIERIGVGAPNANYFSGNIEYAPNLLWKGVLPFAEMLSSQTGIPVVLTNDANAAAIGEMVYGGAKEMKDFVIVTLGTGLGSGFVCNGELLYGSDGFAGELGHCIVSLDNSRLCGCGRYGCLETFVSATGIVRTAIELLEKSDCKSKLRGIDYEELNSLKIAEAATEGDEIALKAFDKTAFYLALALVNVTAITVPEAYFISGGLCKAGNLLFDPLNKYYNEMILPLFKGKTKILKSELIDKNTGLLGAAALAFKY